MKSQQYTFQDINPNLYVVIRIDKDRSVIYVDVDGITVLRISPNHNLREDEHPYDYEIKYE